MDRLLDSERVRTLLRQAEDAMRLLVRLAETGADDREVREALDGIWRDLGKQVHTSYRDMLATQPAPPAASAEAPLPAPAGAAGPAAAPAAAPPPAAPASPPPTSGPAIAAPPTDEEVFAPPAPSDADITDVPEFTPPPADEGEDLERWYTDEVEIEQRQPLFGPGEVEEGAIPEAESLGKLVAGDNDEPESVAAPLGLAQPTVLPQGEWPAWVKSLREIVDLLEPVAADDPHRFVTEASRVQWATSNVEVRWSEFPQPIQVALMGMLAARARFLQERLEVDLGPRMALDRLRRYRRAAGLPTVVGLFPHQRPETGSWEDDSRRWWTVLSQGLESTGGSST